VRPDRATLAATGAAFLVLAIVAAAMLILGGGCSVPRDEPLSFDGGLIDATEIDGGIDDGGVVPGLGDADAGGGSEHVVDSGTAPDLRQVAQDASGDGARDAGNACTVTVELERCGTSDVYRCRVVSDDPTLTKDLHVSGCNAPDGTACAPCCPETPAFLCPGGAR
jgi:hypothetical protein